jgi:REP element-mobilizing transposase RayT
MPNHIHGIIEIRNNGKNNDFVEMSVFAVETPRRGVSTMSDNKPKRGGYNPKWKPNSLGSIINQFKSICTKRIWKSGSHTFAWQSRYWDHIIRNENYLNKIREYIISNPKNWERDRNNAENIFM